MLKEKRILIPNIEKKISQNLKKLEISPQIPPSQFFKTYGEHKHRYFSPCQTKTGKTIAFYARLHNNLDAKKKFIREAKFLKEIQEKNFSIKKVIPKIIEAGKEKDFEWMIREYIPGTTLGHSREITLPLTKKQIKELTILIPEISKIPAESFYSLKLKKFNCRNYLAENVYSFFSKKGIIPKTIENKLLKIIKMALPLAEKENRYFSQGDLNLGNIIVDQEKKFWIIDWELIHINNFAYDIGYLWAHLWGIKRELRNKLISGYLKQLEKGKLLKFKKLLPIVTSYLSLGGIKIRYRKESEGDIEKRRKFYTTLLVNCTKSFEELIKT